jgi:hypothetical protein
MTRLTTTPASGPASATPPSGTAIGLHFAPVFSVKHSIPTVAEQSVIIHLKSGPQL